MNHPESITETEKEITMSANLLYRMFAFLIDVLIIVGACLIIVGTPISFFYLNSINKLFTNYQSLLCIFLTNPTFYILVILFLYSLLSSLYGKSLGNLILKLNVISTSSKKIGFLRTFLRFFVQYFFIIVAIFLFDFIGYGQHSRNVLNFLGYSIFLCILLFLGGNIFAVFDKRNRALHDVICQTSVVSTDKKTA